MPRPPMPAHRVKHGTVAGAAWHYRQPKSSDHRKLCPPCRSAWNKYWKQHARRKSIEARRVRSLLDDGGRGDMTLEEAKLLLNAAKGVVEEAEDAETE